MKNKINFGCPICNEPLAVVKNCTSIFKKTCGNRSCINSLTENSKIKIYGCKNGINKEKMLKTLQMKYGVKNVSQIESVKKKKIKTCIKNFGVKYPMQSPIVIEKSKSTLMNLYGVDNISKVPFIMEKLRDHWFEIDPDLKISKIELASLKRKEKCLEKYGTEFYFQTDEFKNKYKKYCMGEWGVDNYSKTEKFKNFLLFSGLKHDEETKTKFYLYKNKCNKYTGYSYTKYKKELEKIYPRGKKYHIDHNYSMSEGFKNKIDPKIIGSIANLQLLPSQINIKKQDKCWITIEKLNLLYSKLSNEDKFLLD